MLRQALSHPDEQRSATRDTLSGQAVFESQPFERGRELFNMADELLKQEPTMGYNVTGIPTSRGDGDFFETMVMPGRTPDSRVIIVEESHVIVRRASTFMAIEVTRDGRLATQFLFDDPLEQFRETPVGIRIREKLCNVLDSFEAAKTGSTLHVDHKVPFDLRTWKTAE